MVDRNKLLAIPYLKIDEKMLANDDQLSDYSQKLVKFVNAVPEQEESLKLAMETWNYALYIECLIAVWEILMMIKAGDLAEWCAKCLKRIDELEKTGSKTKVDHEKITAAMTSFLTILSSLSLDIQMAMFELPASPEQKETAREKEKDMEKKPPSEKIKLAVDDAPFFLAMLKNCLKNVPFKLFCVTSGVHALRFLKNKEPDLFILDIEMPEMNGYELARRIKQSGRRAPIIFLAGNATEKNVRKAVEAGASDFIVKPINDDLVIKKILKYLGK